MTLETVRDTGLLESWADAAAYRAATYCNLSVLFADAPSAEGLNALIGMACELDGAPSGGEGVARASELDFYRYLAELGERGDDDLRRTVASEYAELFVGPRPPLAPLYESVYVGFPRRLFTEQTMSVRRFYERCGFSVVKDGKVPDDHMAYELELMARLAQAEADAARIGNVSDARAYRLLQREFAAVHLGGWAGQFAERVAQAPCGDFYAALSRFVRDFVAEDDDYLACDPVADDGAPETKE